MTRLIACVLLLASAHALADEAGTTIVGERESAVGLYLAPWQNEAGSDLDRPPVLFDVPLQPLDAARFERQVQYQEAIDAYRRERLFRSR
ncbi:MAG: hypothetical protein ACLGI7_19085 [Gammaproteobacteria bacterium]